MKLKPDPTVRHGTLRHSCGGGGRAAEVPLALDLGRLGEGGAVGVQIGAGGALLVVADFERRRRCRQTGSLPVRETTARPRLSSAAAAAAFFLPLPAFSSSSRLLGSLAL